MPTINRFHPDTCECIIELEVEPDKEPVFLMMNKVCQKHMPLMSTQHAPDHGLKSSRVLALIDQAKIANLKQVDDLISNETSLFRLKDLIICRQLVIQFNQRLDDEWGELIQPPHAFDQHIHDNIKQEQAKAKLEINQP